MNKRSSPKFWLFFGPKKIPRTGSLASVTTRRFPIVGPSRKHWWMHPAWWNPNGVLGDAANLVFRRFWVNSEKKEFETMLLTSFNLRWFCMFQISTKEFWKQNQLYNQQSWCGWPNAWTQEKQHPDENWLEATLRLKCQKFETVPSIFFNQQKEINTVKTSFFPVLC